MDNQIQAGIMIHAQVSGEETIRALSDQLHRAGEETAHLAQQSHQLDGQTSIQTQEIQQLEQSITQLRQHGTQTQNQLAQATQQHTQEIQQLEQSLQRVRPTLAQVAQDLAQLGSGAGGLAYAAREAMGFEAAMAQVAKVTEGTPEQYAQLTEQIQQLAQQLGIMPAQLAQIAAQGGQMGLTLAQLPKFTQMAAEMSVAFGISSEAAGEFAAKIKNVFGFERLEEIERLGDAINALGNTTAAKEAQISEVLMRIGGNAKQFGLTAQAAAALGAAFVSLGKAPEVAGTAINALLTKLQNAKQGTSDFKAALNQLGFSAEEMASKIAANPQKALDDFLAKLAQLDTQSRSEMLGRLFGAEYSDDLALLTGSLDTYQKALKTATDQNQTLGAMQQEVSHALNTTSKRVEQAKAAVSNMATSIGNALLPLVSALAGGVQLVAQTLADWAQQFPNVARLATLFLAAKTAMVGYQQVMRLVGQESQTSLWRTHLSLQQVRQSLLQTTAAAQGLGGRLNEALNNGTAVAQQRLQLRGLAQTLGTVAQGVSALGLAWNVGYGIGTGLRESNVWVRDLGDGLGRMAAYLDAMVSDRTFEDVRKMYRTTREEEALAQQQRQKAAQQAAQLEEQQRQFDEQQAARLRQLQQERQSLSEKIQDNAENLARLNQSGREGGTIAYALQQQTEQYAQKLQQVNAQLMQNYAQISDTSPMHAQKVALEDLGLSVQQVQSGISQAAQKALDDFAVSAQHFGTDAESMARIFAAALSKMDSPEAVAKLKESLAQVGQRAKLTADEIRQIGAAAPDAAERVAQAFEKIGVDSQAVLTGISTKSQQAMQDFQVAMHAAKEQGITDSRLIAAAFEQMLSKLHSPQEFRAFQSQLQQSGQLAQLTHQQLERLNQAIKDGTALNAYQQLEQNLRQSAQAAQQVAQQARQAYQSGQISATQYQTILQQVTQKTQEWQQATQEAGQSAKKAHQNARDAADAQTQAQEQSTQSAQQAAQAINQTAQSTQQASRHISDFGRHITQFWHQSNYGAAHYTQAIAAANHTAQKSGRWAQTVKDMWHGYDTAALSVNRLNLATKSGVHLAQQLAHAQAIAQSNTHKLDQSSLDNLQHAIDAAREKMQALGDDARRALDSAEKELLQAQGNNEAIAKKEHEEKIAQLQRAAQEAQQAGHEEAQEQYQAALSLVEQTYRLKRQQAAQEAEQKRMKEEQAEPAAQEKRVKDEHDRAPSFTEPEKIEQVLPKLPNVAVVDMKSLTDRLRERDQALIQQTQQAMMNELAKQLAAQR